MAIKRNILSQSQGFVEDNLAREELRKLKEQREKEIATVQQVAPAPVKKVSEAKARKDRRQMQINTHFTPAEKKMVEDLVYMMRMRGVGQKDAATEEIVHVAVCHYLKSVAKLEDLRPENSEWWNKELA